MFFNYELLSVNRRHRKFGIRTTFKTKQSRLIFNILTESENKEKHQNRTLLHCTFTTNRAYSSFWLHSINIFFLVSSYYLSRFANIISGNHLIVHSTCIHTLWYIYLFQIQRRNPIEMFIIQRRAEWWIPVHATYRYTFDMFICLPSVKTIIDLYLIGSRSKRNE